MVKAELARTDAPPKIELHPAAVANYKSALDNLYEVMSREAEDAGDGFSISLRDIVQAVLIHPVETGDPIRLEVHGKVAALTGEGGAISMVAGAGFGQFTYAERPERTNPVPYGCWGLARGTNKLERALAI